MIELHPIERQAVDSPRSWAKQHADQYLETAGRDVDHPMAERLVLLYVTGRSSGEVRRIPLASFEHDGERLVVASMGGAPEDPQWFRNLVADPRVWVRFRDDFYEARAEVLTPAERGPAWDEITAAVPTFAGYQEKTDRVIPVVRLRRVPS